jgi:periplasmic protein TonB
MSASALSTPLPSGAAPTTQRLDQAAAHPPTPTPRPLLPPARQASELAPAERRWGVAGVVGLHLLLLWGLLQLGAVRQTLHEVAPLMVHFISLEAPPQPAPTPTPPPAQRPRPARPSPLPVVVVAVATPLAPPAPPVFVAPEPVPVQPAAIPNPPAPAAVVAAVAATPAPVAAPKPVPASALRYAVLPPVELPLISRRLGESGTVLLRVVFDTQGRVKQVSVHRSSGFARLDEQALAAMRRARITPFVDQGITIEVSAIAPLAYELD